MILNLYGLKFLKMGIITEAKFSVPERGVGLELELMID